LFKEGSYTELDGAGQNQRGRNSREVRHAARRLKLDEEETEVTPWEILQMLLHKYVLVK
jgi:hypothetical protein